MFTGIVEDLGRIVGRIQEGGAATFWIEAGPWVEELTVGDSVAVDGACLTVEEATAHRFRVTAIETTLARTIAGEYSVGRTVNLERALRVGSRLDGHWVQGHVDGVGSLQSREQRGTEWFLSVAIPDSVESVTIARGSITINGVSLTVAERPCEGVVGVAIIPHTWTHTNLGALPVGSALNLEGDLIGKYVGRMLAPHLPAGQRGHSGDV